MQKLCPKCETHKSLDAFGKDKHNKDGLSCWCKVCKKEQVKKWQGVNPDKVKGYKNKYEKNFRCELNAKKRERYQNNREDILEKNKIWYKENKNLHDSHKKKWWDKNPHKGTYYAANRRSAKLRATPIWLTGIDKEFMEVTYAMAKVMSDMTGRLHHVDHIYPLQGKDVCGLHVPLNLRVLLAEENLSKGNRLVKE